MSAIALPMIFTSVAELLNPADGGSNSELVPADSIRSVAQSNVPGTTNSNSVPEWNITFVMLSTENQTRNIVWRFSTAVARDAELVKIYNTIGTVVA